MLRAIIRILSLTCLAIALVAIVLDITRSIADSSLVLTSLKDDWSRLSATSLAGFEQSLSQSLPGFLWDIFSVIVLNAPTWAIFAALALLLAMLARRRRPRWQEYFEA